MVDARFRAKGQWSLIPGPAKLNQPLNSQDLQEIEQLSAERIAESFLSFRDMRLIHAAAPSWWEWRARWASAGDFIEIGMTLFGDETQSWGGSPITADCSAAHIDELWSQLRSRHRGIWLHDADCIIHTPESFRNTITSAARR
jgi:hypothetical protein